MELIFTRLETLFLGKNLYTNVTFCPSIDQKFLLVRSSSIQFLQKNYRENCIMSCKIDFHEIGFSYLVITSKVKKTDILAF